MLSSHILEPKLIKRDSRSANKQSRFKGSKNMNKTVLEKIDSYSESYNHPGYLESPKHQSNKYIGPLPEVHVEVRLDPKDLPMNEEEKEIDAVLYINEDTKCHQHKKNTRLKPILKNSDNALAPNEPQKKFRKVSAEILLEDATAHPSSSDQLASKHGSHQHPKSPKKD